MDANNMNATPVTSTPENAQAVQNPVPVTPSPEPRKKSSGKFVFFMVGLALGVFATALLLMSVLQMRGSLGKTVKFEGEGYDTPEEAVTAYAEYLKAGDFDGIVSTFAVESYKDNFNVEKFYDRIRVFSPAMSNSGTQFVMLGNESDLTTAVNIENRKAYISANVFRQSTIPMIEQVEDEELYACFTGGATYVISDDDELDILMDFLNSSPEFEDMEIGKILKASDFNSNYKTGLKEYIKGKEKAWCGDIENVSMKLEIDGEDYVLFMTCVRYDDKWYIAEFGNYYSLAAGISPAAAGLCPKDSLENCLK